MKIAMTVMTVVVATAISGCAGLDFGKEGLSYYEPNPHVFVAVGKDCVSTATLISLPGLKRSVKFKRGYGTADLSVALSNGILTSAGQKTDTKIPETITSISALGTSISTMAAAKSDKDVMCTPSATIYPLVNGKPDLNSPVSFPVEAKIVSGGLK